MLEVPHTSVDERCTRLWREPAIAHRWTARSDRLRATRPAHHAHRGHHRRPPSCPSRRRLPARGLQGRGGGVRERCRRRASAACAAGRVPHVAAPPTPTTTPALPPRQAAQARRRGAGGTLEKSRRAAAVLVGAASAGRPLARKARSTSRQLRRARRSARHRRSRTRPTSRAASAASAASSARRCRGGIADDRRSVERWLAAPAGAAAGGGEARRRGLSSAAAGAGVKLSAAGAPRPRVRDPPRRCAAGRGPAGAACAVSGRRVRPTACAGCRSLDGDLRRRGARRRTVTAPRRAASARATAARSAWAPSRVLSPRLRRVFAARQRSGAAVPDADGARDHRAALPGAAPTPLPRAAVNMIRRRPRAVAAVATPPEPRR